MEIIRGKQSAFMDTSALAERLIGYRTIHIDIGTGDGRFVRQLAQTCPDDFIIGIDACRENLQAVSRRDLANTLFVIANAQAMPSELYNLASQVTINFPWGSLLEGLLEDNAGLMTSLVAILCSQASIEVRLNGGALAQAGWALEAGTDRVRTVLSENGFMMRSPILLTAHDLQSYPTTWAKRLAFGRDPRAIYLQGVRKVNKL
jgi:16S rRNA (adenine(1408)-N(1))-methyltransferase